MTELSDFAETLKKALEASGNRYFGKLVITQEMFDSYRGMSPNAMALKYAEQHKLGEKSKVLTILKEIYALNQKNIFTYSTRDRLVEVGLEYKPFLFILRHLNTFMNVHGDRLQTKYAWTRYSGPVFSDAELVYDIYIKIKKYRLTPVLKKIVDDHIEKPVEEIWALLPITAAERLQIMYRVKETKVQHIAKERVKANPPKPKEKELLSPREIARVPGTVTVEEPKVEEVKESSDNTDTLEEPIDETQGVLCLLNARLDLCMKVMKLQEEQLLLSQQIIENQRKYEELLEKQILNQK